MGATGRALAAMRVVVVRAVVAASNRAKLPPVATLHRASHVPRVSPANRVVNRAAMVRAKVRAKAKVRVATAAAANDKPKASVTARLYRSRRAAIAMARATVNRRDVVSARVKRKATGRAVSVVPRARKTHNRLRRLRSLPSSRSTACSPRLLHCWAPAKADVHAR